MGKEFVACDSIKNPFKTAYGGKEVLNQVILAAIWRQT